MFGNSIMEHITLRLLIRRKVLWMYCRRAAQGYPRFRSKTVDIKRNFRNSNEFQRAPSTLTGQYWARIIDLDFARNTMRRLLGWVFVAGLLFAPTTRAHAQFGVSF